MAVTGVLIFFHQAVALNGMLHKWSGIIMIIAVVLHSIVNWKSIERYAKKSNLARGIVGLGIILLLGSFVNWFGFPEKPEGKVYHAVMLTPISNVATLTGKPVSAIIVSLSKIGVIIKSPNETLDQATKGDEDLQHKVVELLFPTEG